MKPVLFERNTKESTVRIEFPAATPGISTDIPMLSHFLEQLNLYGGLGMSLEARDLMPLGDGHHLTEDVAIALGRALDQALGDRSGLARYGQRLLPMDESLASVALDIGGRPYPVIRVQREGGCERGFQGEMLGGLCGENILHFFRSLALEARFTLHMRLEGENAHHMAEAAFKGLGMALREALAPVEGLRSTKGALR